MAVNKNHYLYNDSMMYNDEQFNQRTNPMYLAEPIRLDTSPYNRKFSQTSDSFMARRYSSPQMGYYDLITGEYRYRSDNFNQSSATSNYIGETEPPMCENTCKCCQVKLPFNCLTISLITCLMLLIMFGLFQAILSTSSSKNPVNTTIFNDMIFLMSLLTVIFFTLIIIRYICIEKFHLCNNNGLCNRFNLLSTVIGDVFSNDGSKHISYNNNGHYDINGGEEFV